MYLLDTNIFLEILLQREKSKAAKHLFIANPSTDLFVTDFSLHSIGVFLFQRNRHETYVSFVKDVIIKNGITVIGLDPEEVLALALWTLLALGWLAGARPPGPAAQEVAGLGTRQLPLAHGHGSTRGRWQEKM